jgi:hypothetical protein
MLSAQVFSGPAAGTAIEWKERKRCQVRMRALPPSHERFSYEIAHIRHVIPRKGGHIAS